MPRRASNSIDALVQEAVDDAVQRATEEIARAIADMAADELTSRLESQTIAAQGRGAARKRGRGPLPGQGRGKARGQRGRRPASAEMTRWAADRRARRVPTFVIELTGLTTKKEIVAKYGEDAAFEKGKPAPKPRA